MIITIHYANGNKERRNVGYTGEQCNAASAPYEKREAPGVKKTPTADFYNDVPTTDVGVAQPVKKG